MFPQTLKIWEPGGHSVSVYTIFFNAPARLLGSSDMNGDNYGCIYDEENVAILQQVYAAGHQIASHTWSHPDITTLSNDQLDVEILRLDQAFIKILGIKPNVLRYVLI